MSQVGKYLNLKPHMSSWRVYNQNGPYTTAYSIGSLAPAQFGGLSYRIRGEKGNDVYLIQTESFSLCAIWAPRDNDSTITSSPAYPNGDLSTGNTKPSNATLINYATKRGLFQDANITIAEFNTKTPISVVSFSPLITVQGELSTTAQLPAGSTYIDISLDGSLATTYNSKLVNLGIEVDLLLKNFQTIFKGVALTGDINKYLKYKITKSGNTIIITLEATLTYETVNVYQRMIISVTPLNNTVRVPVLVASGQTVSNSTSKYNRKDALVAAGIILAIASGSAMAFAVYKMGIFGFAVAAF